VEKKKEGTRPREEKERTRRFNVGGRRRGGSSFCFQEEEVAPTRERKKKRKKGKVSWEEGRIHEVRGRRSKRRFRGKFNERIVFFHKGRRTEGPGRRKGREKKRLQGGEG